MRANENLIIVDEQVVLVPYRCVVGNSPSAIAKTISWVIHTAQEGTCRCKSRSP